MDELIKKWNVKGYETLEVQLLDKTPNFIVVSVTKEKAHLVIMDVAKKNFFNWPELHQQLIYRDLTYLVN